MPEGKEIADCGLQIADWRGHRAYSEEAGVRIQGNFGTRYRVKH